MTATIVTGAAQGIGYATAKRIGSDGKPVVIVGRTAQKIERAGEALVAEGIETTSVVADVSCEADVLRLVETTVKQYGGIQALVNNAGIFEQHSIFELSTNVWDDTLAINLRSAMMCSREAAKYMGQTGRIVNISSMSGLICEPGFAAYNASKAALISLTKSLAVDLADLGILVNCVAPGWVRTAMTEEFLTRISQEEMRRINLQARAARPEEIAEIVAFFVRPDVTFVTGQTLFVDGGQTIMAQFPVQA